MLFCSSVFSPMSIDITSLGEERANVSAFRTFNRFALLWFCLFSIPLYVWEGLWLVIVAFPRLYFYLIFIVLDKMDSKKYFFSTKTCNVVGAHYKHVCEYTKHSFLL